MQSWRACSKEVFLSYSQELVIKRDKESAEVVERLQAECLRLKKQNTIAIENKIHNGVSLL